MKSQHTNKSQSLRILRHLKSGRSITALEALNKYKCFRLAARVHELKRMGYKIKRSMKTRNQKKFASYSI
jgi:Helix-turn-helix domain